MNPGALPATGLSRSSSTHSSLVSRAALVLLHPCLQQWREGRKGGGAEKVVSSRNSPEGDHLGWIAGCGVKPCASPHCQVLLQGLDSRSCVSCAMSTTGLSASVSAPTVH
jgi:hypothetical protein